MSSRLIIIVITALLCSSCAYGPNYDVPKRNGVPTVASIVARIECELTQLVAYDTQSFADPSAYLGPFLLLDNYDVEAFLSIEVDDTGGLSPTLTSIVPYAAAGTSLAVGGTGNLSESRDQTFTESLRFNMKKLHDLWKSDKSMQMCVPQDTPLSGQLGIADFVAMAANNQTGYGFGGLNSLDTSVGLASKGAFGGEIKFVITAGISAAGPTWTLTRFKGPGGLVSFSRVNTDSLTIAFAPHDAAGPAAKASSQNQAAHELVLQIINNSIANSVTIFNVTK